MLEAVQGRDCSLQSLLKEADQTSYTSQQQQIDQEFDPFRTVRSFHRQQRELITQSPMLTTPPFDTREQEQVQLNYIGVMRETPKPQRGRKEKHRIPEKEMRNPMGGIMEEISYIPRESHSMRLPNVMEENVNQLDLTSYMHLPLAGQEGKTCGKCGEQGHVKRQCRANVTCDFCKTKLHATMACRTYANFMKEHPLTSSRKNMPERLHNERDVDQEVVRRVEIKLKRWQKEMGPMGKPPLPQPKRQYLKSSQDVRVQMGEQVHIELHQPQQMKARSYPPNRKVNVEETRNFPGEVQGQVERYNHNPQQMFNP